MNNLQDAKPVDFLGEKRAGSCPARRFSPNPRPLHRPVLWRVAEKAFASAHALDQGVDNVVEIPVFLAQCFDFPD